MCTSPVFSVLSALSNWPAISSALGFCVAVAVNYLLQYYWTFNYVGSHVIAFRRYVSVTLLSFVINLAAFKVLSEHLHVNPLVAQAAAIAIVFVFNFSLNSSYTFAGHKRVAESAKALAKSKSGWTGVGGSRHLISFCCTARASGW